MDRRPVEPERGDVHLGRRPSTAAARREPSASTTGVAAPSSAPATACTDVRTIRSTPTRNPVPPGSGPVIPVTSAGAGAGPVGPPHAAGNARTATTRNTSSARVLVPARLIPTWPTRPGRRREVLDPLPDQRVPDGLSLCEGRSAEGVGEHPVHDHDGVAGSGVGQVGRLGPPDPEPAGVRRPAVDAARHLADGDAGHPDRGARARGGGGRRGRGSRAATTRAGRSPARARTGRGDHDRPGREENGEPSHRWSLRRPAGPRASRRRPPRPSGPRRGSRR
ncbi:hypothetical protein BJF78_03880 [Pseudonocardia sp. CNS-139]|nr:hypothetical protein BJF78_03880 [Pseudonocardia sp. CNS-139]